MNYIPDWNEELAKKIAKSEFINMTPDHWEIIYIIRNFYLNFNLAPSIRILIKTLEKMKYNKKKCSSRYLLKLFPKNPIKQASKIAGVPKTNDCI
ncbi:putative sulfite reductase subunit protein [Buchnera aphidicola str. Bp (Baizongia pistaciae)]|uniref:Sulfurtransferase TusE n=1 Tax=Buchnera aphidicola subsp. Baizongia pistaciae (strain Bp) TaxID=224915 RepID=TUSE_BUCBP|nr:TusE/DsrC/DsvC family sulfur relay protein [Buchnera aphidicola]Q89AA8.1 RecName: Full=Sulfurtransferase TusE; AltName: Full=tRNA 2-thiouridine synthesizing protein E [Buchnera aphidicola str. Bp (Baizongia pistaciae)]AAO27122.1 putative sulfite reductase subunit protein [Buchnera aphidicola str. Bp (Baizongia pistaciae)]